MNREEAKFILRAYRPSGRDANEPMFAEPLDAARQDPQIHSWLEKQRRFDAACAAKLSQLQPPASLREKILAGSRVSVRSPARLRWLRLSCITAAAVFAVTIRSYFRRSR